MKRMIFDVLTAVNVSMLVHTALLPQRGLNRLKMRYNVVTRLGSCIKLAERQSTDQGGIRNFLEILSKSGGIWTPLISLDVLEEDKVAVKETPTNFPGL